MRIADPGAVLVARQLYESLTRWDPVKEKVRPAAAASWDVSKGGRRFTFHLRDDAEFHDGSPVTSHSFRDAFDRIASKESASDLAYTLESIQGFFAVNGSGKRRHLRGIRTPDRSTLVFDLVEPNYGFPEVLTHPGLVPLPEEAFRSPRRFTTHPIGNGPYRLVGEWDPSGPIVLRAFEGGPFHPQIGRIRFVPFPDASVSWFAFTQGELDVAEVPVGQVATARRLFGDRGFVPLAAGLYFGLRLNAGSLDNRELRVAITSAIDRRALAREVFKGTLVPARGIVPEGMTGFSKDACTLCRYAPRLARRAIRDVPRKSRRVTLDYNDDPVQRTVARRVAKNLEAVGLTVKLQGWSIQRYLRRLASGQVSMYRYGWIAEYPSPDAFLSTLFASDAPDNHSGFRSKEVDRLLARARSEPNEQRRWRALRKAERLILRDVPVVPIGSYRMRWAMQRGVRGLHFDTMGGFDAAGAHFASG